MAWVRRLALMSAVMALAIVGAAPATAATAPVGVFPTWNTTGPGQFTGSFSAASGFPDVTVSTDDTGAAIAQGKSAFLGATTGFGKQFGSSRLQPYLTIASLGGSDFSTTTLTFAAPTTPGWGIAVGDIDADYVTLTGTVPGGPLTPAQFGAQDSLAGDDFLNYCANASPKPTGCRAANAPYTDYPELCGTGSTYPLCATLPPGSISAVGHGGDTDGSYDWFMPTVPVTEITLTFTPLSGLPTFQLWLVAPSPAATVTGEVQFDADASLPVPAGTSIALLDDAGAPVRDIEDEPVVVPVATDGSFSFVTPFGDYQLDLVTPGDVAPVGAFPVSLTADSDTVDLGVLAIEQLLVMTGVDPTVPLGLAVMLAAGGVLLTARRRRSA